MTNGMSQMVDERGGSNTNRGNFEAFFDSVYGNAAAEDADFDAAFSNMYGTSAQPAPRQRVSSHEEAMARAQQPGQGEGGFWSGVGEAISEGAKGAGRAVKEGVGGLVVNTVSGLTRLVGTPVRALTGWEGLHKLANAIDESYANFGAQALESEYGANPDGFGYGAGRFGEKLTGIAGNLGGLAAPGGIAKAAKAPAAIKTAAAAVQKSFPYMFGNNAAVQAYDTARENGKSKAEAAALAGLNGAIHFIGFKLFENKSLNKMLGMPQEMEAMMPKWAGEAAAAAPQTFTSLARSVRNGMIKYTLAERGKGMLKAGGIMGVQNLLSDPVMQVAEGKSLDDIDFSRTGMAGLEGLEEGALMEGLMGGAAIYKSPKAAREFIADKLYRGKDYKVIGSDGKPHNEPGLLETPQGRMFIMKQNPAATERVLDIVDHGGKPTKAELDQAFLPTDMSAEELKRFRDDWYNDLSVEEQRGGDEGILGDHEETEMAQGPSRTDVDLAGVRARAREIREEERDERQAGQLIERQAEQMQRAAQEQQAAKEEQDAYDQAMAEYEEGRYLAGKPEPAKTTIEIPDEALKQGAAPEEGKTPTQEKPNETGNGAHEAPAAPEEGTARQPEVGEAADTKAPEPPRGEVPREGVVKLPAEDGRQNLTENRQELTTPEAESKPAEAQEPAKLAEPPKTLQEPSAEVGQAKETPTAERPPEAVSEAPKAESVPEKPAPTNRLKRRDGTDPLAEKEEQAKKGAETTAPLSRTVRKNLVKRLSPILDLVRNKDGSYNPDALRNHDGNGGLNLKDLKRLHEHPEVIDDLGLKPEAAAALRSAVHDAYEEQLAASPNRKDKTNETGQYTYSVSASMALERLARNPKSIKQLGIAYQQVLAAMTSAKERGDEQGVKFWEDRLSALNNQIGKLSPSDQNKALKSIRDTQLKKSAMERKNAQSLESGEGGTLDVAAEDERIGRAIDEEAVAQTNSISGGVGKGAALSGNRYLRIDKVDGDELTVTLMDTAGKPRGAAQKMNRTQWEMLGKAAAINDDIDGDPSNPQKGDMLRMSKAKAGTHDYANDADYQKWLKSRKANDAEPLRERYEQEQAKAAAERGKLLLRDANMELNLDREYDPNVDGDGRTIEDSDSGRVVGTFNRETNKLKLFRGATIKTLVHELGGHATLRFAEQEAERGNRQLLDRINRAIDEAPQALKDEIRRRYPGVDETALRDEIWAALRERNSPAMEKAIKTLQGKAWYNRAWSAFRDAWKGLLARMGFNRADLSQIDRMSNDEFLSYLDRTMAEGKTLGRLERGNGEGQRAMLEPETFQKISDAIKKYKEQGGEEKIRKSVTSAPAKGNPIDDVRPKGERLQEGAQDSDISIRNLQRDLGGVEDKQTESGHTDAKTTFNKDGTVKELGSTDVYSAKMRMNGHLQAGFNEIKSGQNTIDKTLADNGLTQAQFDKFLYASHAPERNQTIAERMAENANKAEWRKARAEAEKGNTAPLEALRRAVKVDTASKEYSGMSTDEANAYLASPEVASKRAALESAANELYKMERKNLDRLLESGRISKEFYDLLTTRWKKYVPLRTDVEGKDGAAYNLSVGGFRQNEFLTAEGRKTEADSPYTFAMLQVQQGLRGSEANTVHLTAANLVRKAEQQGYHIGDIIEGKEMGRGKGWTFQFADGDMVQVGGDMKLAKNRKDIILFKENGELKAIRLVKGANGRGEAVADAITGRNVQQWHKDLAFIPKWTRWLSAMRTQYSPEFIFSNALADHMESTQALIGRYGIKDGGKLAGQALVWEKRNLGDLRRYIKTGDAGNGYVKEAIDAGVLIKGGVAAHGYAGELKDIQSSYDRFVRDAKGFGNMTAKEKTSFVWDGLKDFISHTNELIENSTRIGIYSALREKGVSKADAVKFAREATVDFNRKGGYTPWVNGLFMFSNASVQGAVRSVQAMKDTHGKELIGLLVAAGVAKAGLDYFLGNDEDREKEGGRNARNLSEYDKKHKLGIPIPGTSYQVTALRMRGPYAVIPYLAQTFTNVALGETKTADAAKTVVRELTDQATDLLSGNGVFNDKGEFDGALLGQSLAPTLADPLVQWATGKDYKGDEYKARAFDKTMPLSSNGKRNTPVPYKAAAEFINKITGGNENRKGLADIAPEDLQLVVEFLAGGVGRDIGNVVSTGQNIKEFATGGSPERTLSQMPLARTLVNEYPENTNRYFDALDAYERDKAEFKKTTDIERRREMKKEKPYLFTGKSLLDGQIDKVKELTHLERGEVKSGNKWIEPKKPRSEAQKEKYREQRLRLQATILRQLKA